MRSLLSRLLDLLRQAAADGPFAMLVYILFAGLPMIGFAYLLLRVILAPFGIELPQPTTSVQ